MKKVYKPDHDIFPFDDPDDKISIRLNSFSHYLMRTFSLCLGSLAGDLVLGEPLQLYINNYSSPNLLLTAPPAHIDGICDETGVCSVVNVSYYDSFATGFQETSSSSNTMTIQDSVDKRTGVDLSYQNTAKISADDVASVERKLTGSLGFAWETYKAETETQGQGQQFRTNVTLDEVDDLLLCSKIELNLWRYPILDDAGDYSGIFLEVGEPYLTTETNAGAMYAWYQPEHERGNLFSYPWYRADEQDDDVEVLSADAEMGIKVNHTAQMTLSETSTEEEAEKKSFTFSLGLGLSYATQAKLSGDVTGLPVDISGGSTYGANFSYSSTKTHLETSSLTVSQDQTITIKKDGFSVDEDQAYSYEPRLVRNTDGQIFLSFRVPASSVDKINTWWQAQYTTPDVALNLPYRWTKTSSQDDQWTSLYSYVFNADSAQLSRMKGFFVMDGKKDGATQKFWAEPGEDVWLWARIYNYSLEPITTAFNVKFYYEICDQDGEECSNGTQIYPRVSISGIPAWGNASNQPNWAWAKVKFTIPNTLDNHRLKF